jgi:hypothetical protein
MNRENTHPTPEEALVQFSSTGTELIVVKESNTTPGKLSARQRRRLETQYGRRKSPPDAASSPPAVEPK